ncbi:MULTISPECIES: T7SS effector LXG polymorphic toxin [Bacillaceae]|uniref:LXG domain-containing protein n=1 Tax=Evansella alkalicola TaxID=745819 RepID=A0ABS6JW07_9BACI|nr:MULTISPECIES: T7SS effector LXG polymorphic toxin [Bacillaceae]MBU9722769.1 LXG domain-containing protein [Bacillus alkalicola]
MGQKVDLAEVIDFSKQFKAESESIKDTLFKVEQNIKEICNMSSFSGKTADQAKLYFSDFHLTVLTTFMGLFTDLSQNLNRNIEQFQSRVDQSSRAIIDSDHVREIMEDVTDQQRTLEALYREINDTIRSISDISSASTPSFSNVQSEHDSVINGADHLFGDMHSFTRVGRGSSEDIKTIIGNLESTLNHTGKVNSSARFTDFKGVNGTAGLAALKEYNKSFANKDEVDQHSIQYMSLAQIEQLNNAALIGMDETIQRVLITAFDDLKNGVIDRKTYYNIFATMKKSTVELSEEELMEEVPESVIEFIYRNKVKIGIDLAVNSTAGAMRFIGHTTTEIGKSVGQVGTAIRSMGGSINEVGTSMNKLGTSIKSIGGLFSKLNTRVGNAITNVGSFTTKTSTVLTESSSLVTKSSTLFSKSSSLITKTGQAVQGAGRVLGGTFVAVSAGFGFYEDITEKGKTVGEAIMHNGTSVAVGLAGGAIGAGLATSAAALFTLSNPVGWAIAGSVVAGAGLTWGFNYLYDNNIGGLQDGLDALGRNLDKVGKGIASVVKDPGEAISSGLSAINPLSWGW